MTNLETILENILTRLDKIIENQEKQSIKPTTNLSDLLLETKAPYYHTEVIGKEHVFPTPYNNTYAFATTEDVLPEYRSRVDKNYLYIDPNSTNKDTSICNT